MEDQLRHLAQLSQIDDRILAVRKHQTELPARIDELRTEIAHEKALLEQKIARKDEMVKARRKLEAELADLEARIEREKEREMKVKTNEEFHAIQREVRMAKQKQDEVEEKILILMEEISEFEKEIARADKRLAEFRGRTEEEIRQLEGVLAGADAEIERQIAVREEVTRLLHPEVLERYNLLLAREISPAVVRAVDGVCTGCHSRLQPQLFNQIIAAADIYSCPHCYRLLFVADE